MRVICAFQGSKKLGAFGWREHGNALRCYYIGDFGEDATCRETLKKRSSLS